MSHTHVNTCVHTHSCKHTHPPTLKLLYHEYPHLHTYYQFNSHSHWWQHIRTHTFPLTFIGALHNYNANMILYGRIAVPPTSGWLKLGTLCPLYVPSKSGWCIHRELFKTCCEHCLCRVRGVARSWGAFVERLWSVCGVIHKLLFLCVKAQGKGSINTIWGAGDMGT